MLKQKKKEIEVAREDIERGGRECQGMEKELAEIEARRAKEMAKGGKVQALTDAVNELERELVKVKTQLEIKESTVSDDVKRIDSAKNGVKDVSNELNLYRSSQADSTFRLRRHCRRSAKGLRPTLLHSQSSRPRTTLARLISLVPRSSSRLCSPVCRLRMTTRVLVDTWAR
jgi:chromosome segregation ATPase